jgi:hypothetical protein
MSSRCKSRHDAMCRAPAQQAKKRRVQEETRLPTKRMATACWAFIVAKSIPWKAAPMLDFASLWGTNKESYKQIINKSLCVRWGQLHPRSFIVSTTSNPGLRSQILASRPTNLRPPSLTMSVVANLEAPLTDPARSIRRPRRLASGPIRDFPYGKNPTPPLGVGSASGNRAGANGSAGSQSS